MLIILFQLLIIMLVHLKPKRTSKCNQIMENYIQKTNWNYRLTNPIHCKRNQNSRKIKDYLTQKVCTQGKSIESSSPKYTKYSIDTSILKRNIKQLKNKQTNDEDKKKNQQWEKCTVIELSTLYKKSFKYNTTIHQILKNLTKNYDPKNIRESNQTTNKQSRDTVKSQPILHPQKFQNQQPQSSVKSRLKKLQTIKNQCSKLQIMDERQQDKCYHVSQLKFVDNQQGKSIMKSSLYQWKSNKPHFTKLKWRKHSVNKKNMKNGATQEASKIKVQIHDQTQQSILDSMFYPYCNQEGIFTTYNSNTVDHYHFNQMQKINEEIFQRQCSEFKKKIDLAKTQRSFFERRKNIEKNLKTMREHKLPLKLGNEANPEFSLQAWSTKQKQQCQVLQNLAL